MFKKSTIICIFCISLFSCSRNYIIEDNFSGFNDKKIAVLSPILLQKVFNYKDETTFEKNLYIGTIDFQGGLINNKQTGYITKAKIRNYDNQKEFRNIIIDIFHKTIIYTLTKDNRKFEFVDTNDKSITGSIIKPEDVMIDEDIVKRDDFKRDNINFPVYIYTLKSVQNDALTEIRKKYNPYYLLIPVIEYYYIHNSGWFNGQDLGCTSGYRSRLHIYILDIEKNKIVYLFKNDEKKRFKYKYVYDKYEMKEWQQELNLKIRQTLEAAIP